MTKITTDFEAILTEAHNAAYRACTLAIVERPECDTDFDCGFAWVTISGNEPLARYCRKNMDGNTNGRFYGGKGYPNGWQWWKPGKHNGQSVRIFEAGARAFRDALAKYGIVATVGSRLD